MSKRRKKHAKQKKTAYQPEVMPEEYDVVETPPPFASGFQPCMTPEDLRKQLQKMPFKQCIDEIQSQAEKSRQYLYSYLGNDQLAGGDNPIVDGVVKEISAVDGDIRTTVNRRMDVTLRKLREAGYCTEKSIAEAAKSSASSSDVNAVIRITECMSTAIFEAGLDVNDSDPVSVTDEDWKRAIDIVISARYPEKMCMPDIVNFSRFLIPNMFDIYATLIETVLYRTVCEICGEEGMYKDDEEYALQGIRQEMARCEDAKKQVKREQEMLVAERKKFEAEKQKAAKEAEKSRKRIRELEFEVEQLRSRAAKAPAGQQEKKDTRKMPEDTEKELRRRISSLESRLAAKDEQMKSLRGGMLLKSEPIDYFPGEQRDYLVHIIRQLAEKTDPESRAHAILQSLASVNESSGTGEAILEELDRVFSGCKGLTDLELNRLRSLGFTYEKGGKHTKLRYRNTRYVYAISVSPSDWRAGQHQYADVSKCVAVSHNI